MDLGKIYTVTLNPALDRILYLDEFDTGITNRLTGQKNGIGGKGMHVALNLKALGEDSVASGLVHGNTGMEILHMLEKSEVGISFIHCEKYETRTNYLVIEESGASTCLAEKGVALTEQDLDEYIELLKEEVDVGDYLVLAGGVSNCPDPLIYNRIMDELAYKNLKVFIDTSGEALKQCIKNHPFLIKPNKEELEELTGRTIEEPMDIMEAVESLSEYEIPIIAVSLADEGAVIKVFDTYYVVDGLKVDVRNTIGCGDCFLAGMIFGIKRDLNVRETMRIAMAASAATAESSYSVGFNYERFLQLKKQVKITQLN